MKDKYFAVFPYQKNLQFFFYSIEKKNYKQKDYLKNSIYIDRNVTTSVINFMMNHSCKYR